MSEISFGKRKGIGSSAQGTQVIDGVKIEHLQSRNVVRVQGFVTVEDTVYNAESMIGLPDAPDVLLAVAKKLMEIAEKQSPSLRR